MNAKSQATKLLESFETQRLGRRQLCLLKRTLLVDESSGTSSEAESEADGDIEEQETRPKKKGGKNQAGKNQTAAGNKSASATTGMGTSIRFM